MTRENGKWLGRIFQRSFIMPAGFILVIALGSFIVGGGVVDYRSQAILSEAEQRAELVVHIRKDIVGGWLGRWDETTQALRNSPNLQLFAEKAAGARQGESVGVELTAYMQALIDGFFNRRPDVSAAWFLDSNGRAFLSTAGAAPLDEGQRARARALFESGAAANVIDPMRETETGLVFDLYFPIHPAQAKTAEEAARPVAMLVLTINAEAALAEILNPAGILEDNERLILTQGTGADIKAAMDGAKNLAPLGAGVLASAASFGKGPTPGDESRSSYLFAEKIEGTPWSLLYARFASEIDGELMTIRIFVFLLGLAMVVCTGGGVVLLWWRQSLHSSRQLADQYRDFAETLETERNLLDAINNAINEIIYVINLERKIAYANDSFIRLTGGAREWVGRDVDFFLSPHLAAELSELDRRALAGETVSHRVIRDDTPFGTRWYNFSKDPLRGGDGEILAVVTVCSDITEQHLERQRQRDLMRSTIRVLTSSVVAVDPYLANQANRLSETALGVAEIMGLSEDECATLQIAGDLSQVGKIFLPRGLISKEGRLSPEERHQLEGYIQLTLDAIQNIHFELPVREALAQLQEKLDGSGYPNHLKGDQISLAGRILSVSNVFAARTETRSYRNALAPAEVLAILRENADKYDDSVVNALEKWLATANEKSPDA